MSLDASVLFEPFRVRSLEIKNRIVMAPMTRSFSPGGVPGPDVAAYYGRRASGGVGLILSEGSVVDRPASRNEPGVPSFHSEEALAGWKRVIEAVHAENGKMGPQIWHVGSVPSPMTDWLPSVAVESPSGLLAPGAKRGDAMSDAAIADTLCAFGRAAADAKRLGFDMVEIHAAHGYLIDQFFWGGTNLRTDFYGGATIGERARFGAEIVKAVRAEVGPDFAIAIRLSQWKQQDFTARLAETPEAMAQWLTPLVAAGADLLHCSQRRYWEPEFPQIDGEDGLNFAGWAKKLTGAATISVGSVGLSGDFLAGVAGESSRPTSLQKLVQRFERGEFDLIAVGRAILADPDWVSKVRDGKTEALKGFTATTLAQLY